MSRLEPFVTVSSLALAAVLAATPASGAVRTVIGADEGIGQDGAAPADWNANDLIFVMPPLKPLTGAAAPTKKKRARSDGAAPPAQPAPAAPATSVPPPGDGVLQPVSVDGAPLAAPALSGPLPELALVAAAQAEEWPAPARGVDWAVAGLQEGAAPTLTPALDPLPPAETAETGVAVEPDAGLAALLAQGREGPVEVRLADRATLWLPAGRVFYPPETARKLLAEAGLEWRETMQGLVAPAGGRLDWFAPVELVDEGHVHAEDAATLDAEKLLADFRATLPALNARRAGTRAPAVTIEGWLSPPALDDKRRLSVCVSVASADPAAPDRFFNCEGWALGREGAIKVGLAASAEQAERLAREIGALVGAIVFDHGKTYEDYDPATDRAAAYGASDLLIHDVVAKPAPPSAAAPAAPATEPEGGASLFDTLASLLYPMFGTGALFLAYIRWKRARAQNSPPVEDQPEVANAQQAEPKGDAAAAGGAISLIGRLTAMVRRAPGLDAAAGALGDAMRGGLADKDASATPADDAEAPVSALRKFASRMRGVEEAPPAVDPTRAFRRPRRQGGAATAPAEEIDLGAAMVRGGRSVDDLLELAQSTTTSRAAFAPATDVGGAASTVEDFVLVEPGDAKAASAALNVIRAAKEV